MKHYIHICILIFSFLGVSSGEELTRDAQELLSKRNEAVERIDKIFVNELEKLKVNYTRKGDLDSANAIVTLIEKFRIEDESEPLSKVFGKTFSWSADGKDAGLRLVLLEGGKGTFKGMAITWEKLGIRKIRITHNAENKSDLEWAVDCKSFTGVSTLRGQKLAGRLVE